MHPSRVTAPLPWAGGVGGRCPGPFRFEVSWALSEVSADFSRLCGLPGVDLAVLVQAGAAAVHLVTLSACILLGHDVHFHVSNEVVSGIKDPSTLIARERFAVDC